MSALARVLHPSYPSADIPANITEPPHLARLIKTLHLLPHPEGGYYAETDRDQRRVPNPFTNDINDASRAASSTIFYLLTPDSPLGHFHRNKARTMHLCHRGTGRYVVLHVDETPARIETFVVGQNAEKGERLQWMVEGGKYKASFLLADEEREGQGLDSDGLLISEVCCCFFLGFAMSSTQHED